MIKSLKQCDCHSYNAWTDGTPNVILTIPDDMLKRTGGNRNTVCIDACIADVIQALWARSMDTLNSCCGHGKIQPWIIIPEGNKPTDYFSVLAEIDPERDWVVSRWERMDYEQAPAQPLISEQCEVSQKRLEVIGYGSVPASIEEQRSMARALLSSIAQPFLIPKLEPVAWRCDNEVARGVVITVHKAVANSWVLKGWKVTPLIESSTVLEECHE